MEFTPEKKWQIIREGRNKPRNISTVCAKYGISRETFYEWERQVEAAALAALRGEKPGPKPAGYIADPAAREQLEAVEHQRQALEKEVRELRKQVYLKTLEQDWIKFRISQITGEDLQKAVEDTKKSPLHGRRKRMGHKSLPSTRGYKHRGVYEYVGVGAIHAHWMDPPRS